VIADWPTDDIARLIARYPPARLPVRLFLRRLHPPEMPPKVDEEEAEPLKNDVFGSVVQTIKGKSLPGGIRNSVTIYENGALVTSLQTYDAPACGFKQGCVPYCKGFSGSRSCPMYFCTCCPLNEARFMIPKHRFMGAYLKKQMCCGGACTCCTPTLTSMIFQLTDDEEVMFIMNGKLKDEEYNAIFSFVYGSLTTTGLGDKAHALGILAHDNVISQPSAEFSFSMNRE
jgi:hypothetical protein